MVKNYALLVAAAFFVAYVVAPTPSDQPVAASAPVAEATSSTSDSSSSSQPEVPLVLGNEMRLQRGPGGHFFTTAKVNGVDITFVVDTGASGVALTQDDARKAGIHFYPHEFTVVGTGASGPVNGKLVKLDRVALGSRTVEDVDGAILADGEISLLGQSFLSRVGKIEIDGDEMKIS